MALARRDLERLLESLGCVRTQTHDEWRCVCPRCGRVSETPIGGTLSVNASTGAFVCYRCQFASSRIIPLLVECGVDRSAARGLDFDVPVEVEACSFDARPAQWFGRGQREVFPVPTEGCPAYQYLDRRLGGRLTWSGVVRGTSMCLRDVQYVPALYALLFPVSIGQETYGSIRRLIVDRPNEPKYKFASRMATGRLLTCATGESVFVANLKDDVPYLHYGGSVAPWGGTKRSLVVVEGLFDAMRLQMELDLLDPSRRCQVVMSYGRALSRYQLHALNALDAFDRIYLCWDGYGKDIKVPESYAKVHSMASDRYPALLYRMGFVVYPHGDPGSDGADLARRIAKAESDDRAWSAMQRNVAADPLRMGMHRGPRTLESLGRMLFADC